MKELTNNEKIIICLALDEKIDSLERKIKESTVERHKNRWEKQLEDAKSAFNKIAIL